MNRTERLYKIQALLESRKLVRIDEFLSLLEVSRATFRRDLEYLRDRLGAPIYWDRDQGGYRLLINTTGSRNNSLPGLWFNESEIFALMSMAQMISSLEPNDLIKNQITPIRQRLENLLASGSANATEMANRIRILPNARRPVNVIHFQTIASALLERKRIDITHTSRETNEQSTRQVSPQQLLYYRDNWYLDAFCHTRDDLRSFSVDAISQAKRTDKPAVSLPPETFRNAFATGYGIFGSEIKHVAKLRFSPFRARWVAHEIWHPDQKSQFNESGAYTLEIPYGDDRELVMDILRQGPDCEVISPDSLRVTIKEKLQKSLMIYAT